MKSNAAGSSFGWFCGIVCLKIFCTELLPRLAEAEVLCYSK